LNWLDAHKDGGALIHDDNRHWAFAWDGMQKVVTGMKPQDYETYHAVDAKRCRLTARDAIDAAMDEDESET
jgi:hypothetical protein